MDVYTVYFFKRKTKQVNYPLARLFFKIWKNTISSRGKKHLDKLPCQISAIKFTGNSMSINFCARRSQSRTSMKHLLGICTCAEVWEREDITKSLGLSLKRLKISTKAVRDIKQKKHNRTPQKRSVATEFAAAQLDTF